MVTLKDTQSILVLLIAQWKMDFFKANTISMFQTVHLFFLEQNFYISTRGAAYTKLSLAVGFVKPVSVD